MISARIPETDRGIVGAEVVAYYDEMNRRMRDLGYLVTPHIIHSGITGGLVLEIGPGPGYLGLEWLKNTTNTRLKGLDISMDMIKLEQKNAWEYGLESRVEYIAGDAKAMPFVNNTFDGVISNSSMHEWDEPELFLNEIFRVLKPGGKFFIGDFRRDLSPATIAMMETISGREIIRQGLLASINAAYTVAEIEAIFNRTHLKNYKLRTDLPPGLMIMGEKLI